MSSTISKTEHGHAKFREGKFEEALELYAEALSAANLKAHRVALHSNRAACYLKLQKFKQAAAECSAVLELDEKHTGALMLRAQTLVMLKDYHSALFDVNRLLEIDPGSQVYDNLKSRIKTQLALAPIPEAENESYSDSVPNSPMSKSPRTVLSPALTPVSNASISVSNASTSIVDPKVKPGLVPPKTQSRIDYSRWNNIGDDLSDNEEDEEDQPRYQYRLKTIGLRAAASY